MEEKKKLYQKWWFWVCIISAVLIISLLIIYTLHRPKNNFYIYIDNFEKLNQLTENDNNKKIILFGKIQSIRSTNVDNNYLSEIILTDNNNSYVYLDYDKKNNLKKGDMIKVMFNYKNTFLNTGLFDFETYETYTTNKVYYIVFNNIIDIELKV